MPDVAAAPAAAAGSELAAAPQAGSSAAEPQQPAAAATGVEGAQQQDVSMEPADANGDAGGLCLPCSASSTGTGQSACACAKECSGITTASTWCTPALIRAKRLKQSECSQCIALAALVVFGLPGMLGSWRGPRICLPALRKSVAYWLHSLLLKCVTSMQAAVDPAYACQHAATRSAGDQPVWRAEPAPKAPEQDKEASALLGDCINTSARMLSCLFADGSTTREFVDRGGEASLPLVATPSCSTKASVAESCGHGAGCT